MDKSSEYIRTLLSQHDPLTVISEVQSKHGLDLPNVGAVYPLLDFQGFTRHDVHKACLNAITSSILAKINDPEFSVEQFHKLLNQTLPHIMVPHLQPIPMALLERYPDDVNDDILKMLKEDPALFEQCPMSVKRRIWKSDEAFFQTHLLRYFNTYHHDTKLQLMLKNSKPERVSEVLKERRQHPVVQQLIEIIGRDVKLYTMFTEMIRIVFLSTPHPILSTLKFDVLMRLHEDDVREIYDRDPCHKLTWTLNTCIRNQSLDSARINKIRECFDDAKREPKLYADFALILMDPATTELLSKFIVKWIRMSVDENAPQNLEEQWQWAARMLNLGHHAHNIAMSGKYKPPKMDREVYSQLWNTIGSLILEEQYDTEAGIDTDRDMESKDAQVIDAMLPNDEIARDVFCQYVLERTIEGDIHSLARCLKHITASLPTSDENVLHTYTYQSFYTTFINLLIRHHLGKCVLNSRWRSVIMDNFLLPSASWDSSVHLQIIQMFSDYYEPKMVNSLGDQITIIESWANTTCSQLDLASAKSNKEFYDAYHGLLEKSHKNFDGQYGITPPAVLQFLRASVGADKSGSDGGTTPESKPDSTKDDPMEE
ncbi:hypothetical protein INT44_005332 [Umbelopsis vinacea]|uniref:Uncharacterized protein n=1 Tax=Umbelopsis vinacea TaxID=44442 RepID=A0A8H7UMX6_9FUNG|nr:hypothetical protein INT44_005332 [Umbelopsis vinacea]